MVWFSDKKEQMIGTVPTLHPSFLPCCLERFDHEFDHNCEETESLK